MPKAANPEIGRARGLSIFREIHGEELHAASGVLRSAAASKNVSVFMPKPDATPQSWSAAQIRLIKMAEIMRNSDIVYELAKYGRGLREELIKEVPSLSTEIGATAESVVLDRSDQGEHFLQLELDEASVAALEQEREGVRDALVSLSGLKNLQWRNNAMDIKLAYFAPGSAAERHIEMHGEAILSALPTPVTLEPVAVPDLSRP